MPGRPPTFLVIGAMKSGTTTLSHHLGDHPDVFMLPQEGQFFDRHPERGMDWYRDLFASATTPAIGESTPSYMYVEHVAPAVARDLPGVRAIAILRDPVRRAYSHYWHNRTRGHEPLEFEAALQAEPERLTRGLRDRIRYSYADRGLYAEQLERFTRHVPLVKVVLFEELVRDPAAALGSIYEFIGVDPNHQLGAPDEARNRSVSYRSQRARGIIRKLPTPLARVAGRANIRYTSYPPMSDAAAALLRAQFEPANQALVARLGRDLDGWS
jgi:hypothetical protein